MGSYLHRLYTDNRSAILQAVVIFFFSRLLLVFAARITNRIFDFHERMQDVFCVWDCGWYLRLVQDGYDSEPSGHAAGDAANWAFFPLYPILTRMVGDIFSLSYLWAGYLISNICFLLALIIFFNYCRLHVSERDAIFATCLLGFSPYSFVFSSMYTESLFIVLVVSVFLCTEKRYYLRAGLLAALLSATRNVGVFVVFPMLLIVARQHGIKNLIKGLLALEERSLRIAVALLLAPLGLFIFMFYLHSLVGDAFAFKSLLVAWERPIGNPVVKLINGLSSSTPFEVYLALFTMFGLLCGVILAFQRMWPECLFTFILITIPLTTGVQAIPRYIAPIFPIYLGLARVAQSSDTLRFVLLAASALWSGFLVTAWVTQQGFMA